MLGDPGFALAACRTGLSVDPDDAELLFRQALVLRTLSDTTGAEAGWRRILGLRPPTRFASVVTGIYGHLTRRHLAAVVEERGETGKALRLWGEVLVEPGAQPALSASPGPVAPLQSPPVMRALPV
jgi:hypothetical protein